MPRDASRKWLVRGSHLDTGEPSIDVFDADSEVMARAKAKVQRIAVQSVEEIRSEVNPALPDPIGYWDDASPGWAIRLRAPFSGSTPEQRAVREGERNLIEQSTAEAAQRRAEEAARRAKRTFYVDNLEWRIAVGIVLGNLLWWGLCFLVMVVFFGGSCAAFLRAINQ